MKFTGFCNGGQTKALCSNVSEALYEEIDVPVKQNGFIATGHQKNDKCLIVVDINMPDKKKIHVDALDFWFDHTKTLVVESGSGNLHYYFYVSDGEYNTFEFSEEAETLKFIALNLNITKVDVLGNGGKVFAPGCRFADHGMHEYSIVANNIIAVLKLDKFKALISELVDIEKPNNIILSNDVLQTMLVSDEQLMERVITREAFNSKLWIPILGDWFVASGINCYYIVEIKEWLLYSNGAYKRVNASEITHVIRVWLSQNDFKLSKDNVSCALDEIIDRKSKSITAFNTDKTVINVNNGLLHKTTKKLLPHTPKLKTTEQFNFYYNAKPKKTPYIDKMFEIYPEQMMKLKKYLQAILYKDVRIGLMLFIYGKTGSGKGTVLRMIGKAFEYVKSNMSICTIGDDWNLQQIVGKLVNIDPDANMASMSDKTLTVLKRIVDPERQQIPVPIIYGGVKLLDIDTFFITATNLLAKMPKMTDLKAFFKRIEILVFNEQFNDDPTFSDGVYNECDDFFSRLLTEPYIPLDSRTKNAVAHAEEMMKLWYFYSNPIRAACNDLFERVNKSDTSDFSRFKIECLEAVEFLRFYLTQEKYDIDLEQVNLSWHLTNVFGKMGIEKRRHDNASEFCYYPVRIKPQPLLDIYFNRLYSYIDPQDDNDADKYVEKLDDIIINITETLKDDNMVYDRLPTDTKNMLIVIINKTKMPMLHKEGLYVISRIKKRIKYSNGETKDNRILFSSSNEIEKGEYSETEE